MSELGIEPRTPVILSVSHPLIFFKLDGPFSPQKTMPLTLNTTQPGSTCISFAKAATAIPGASQYRYRNEFVGFDQVFQSETSMVHLT